MGSIFLGASIGIVLTFAIAFLSEIKTNAKGWVFWAISSYVIFYTLTLIYASIDEDVKDFLTSSANFVASLGVIIAAGIAYWGSSATARYQEAKDNLEKQTEYNIFIREYFKNLIDLYGKMLVYKQVISKLEQIKMDSYDLENIKNELTNDLFFNFFKLGKKQLEIYEGKEKRINEFFNIELIEVFSGLNYSVGEIICDINEIEVSNKNKNLTALLSKMQKKNITDDIVKLCDFLKGNLQDLINSIYINGQALEYNVHNFENSILINDEDFDIYISQSQEDLQQHINKCNLKKVEL